MNHPKAITALVCILTLCAAAPTSTGIDFVGMFMGKARQQCLVECFWHMPCRDCPTGCQLFAAEFLSQVDVNNNSIDLIQVLRKCSDSPDITDDCGCQLAASKQEHLQLDCWDCGPRREDVHIVFRQHDYLRMTAFGSDVCGSEKILIMMMVFCVLIVFPSTCYYLRWQFRPLNLTYEEIVRRVLPGRSAETAPGTPNP